MAFLNTNTWNELFSKNHENNSGIDSSELGTVSMVKTSVAKPTEVNQQVSSVKENKNDNKLELDDTSKLRKSESPELVTIPDSDLSENRNKSNLDDIYSNTAPNTSDSEVKDSVSNVNPNQLSRELEDTNSIVSPNHNSTKVLDSDPDVKLNFNDSKLEISESSDVKLNFNDSKLNDLNQRVTTNKNQDIDKVSEKDTDLYPNQNARRLAKSKNYVGPNQNKKEVPETEAKRLESKSYKFPLAPDSNYSTVGGSSLGGSYWKNAKKEWISDLENKGISMLSNLIPNQILQGNNKGGLNITGNLIGDTGNSIWNLMSGGSSLSGVPVPSISNWDLGTAYLSIKGLRSGDISQVSPGTNYLNLGTNLIIDSLISSSSTLSSLLGTKTKGNHKKYGGVTQVDINQGEKVGRLDPHGLIYRGKVTGAPAHDNKGRSSSISNPPISRNNFSIPHYGIDDLKNGKKPFTLFDNSRWAITFTRLGYYTPQVPYTEYFGNTGFQPVTDFSLSTVEQDQDQLSYADEYSLTVPSKLRYNMSLTMNVVNDSMDTVNDFLRRYRGNMYGYDEFLYSKNTESVSNLVGVKNFRKCTLLVNIFIYNRQQRLLNSKYRNSFDGLPDGYNYNPDVDKSFSGDSYSRFFVNYYGLVCIPKLNQDSFDGVNKGGSSRNIVNLSFDVVGFWNNPDPGNCDLVESINNELAQPVSEDTESVSESAEVVDEDSDESAEKSIREMYGYQFDSMQ